MWVHVQAGSRPVLPAAIRGPASPRSGGGISAVKTRSARLPARPCGTGRSASPARRLTESAFARTHPSWH